MGIIPNKRDAGVQEAYKSLIYSPENFRLQACEDTPVNKKIFEITPLENIVISKISYGIGSNDLSANGYITVVMSKLDNPNIYAVSQNNSQIVFEKMAGANGFVEGESIFHIDYRPVLLRNETLFIYLISNIPANVKALIKLTVFYNPIYL